MKYEIVDYIPSQRPLCVVHWENGNKTEFFMDEDTESPRTWEPLGKMAMWSYKYNLPNELASDEPEFEDFADFMYHNKDLTSNSSGEDVVAYIGIGWVMMYAEYWLDQYRTDKLIASKGHARLVERALNYVNKNYIWHYVSMYDHSGISFSHTSSYERSGWDSSVVGCHFVSHETLANEYKGMTKAQRLIKGHDMLEDELDVFNNWIMGNCFYFIHKNESGEELDACGGFIVDCLDTETMLKEVEDYIRN